MENLKSGFKFLTSSYKRTGLVLFIAALTLAIPITLSLVSQQQDIRQRADVLDAGVISFGVFVTSTKHQGNFGGIAAADAICQERARAVGATGTFKAWISDSTTNAKDRIADVRYAKPDGTLIANNLSDLLDGNIENKIDRDEMNQEIGDNKSVWTGTKKDGTFDEKNCSNWTDLESKGTRGKTDQNDEDWTDDDDKDCDESYRIYCFSQPTPPSPTFAPTATPVSTCGDGVCQDAACLSTNCALPENASNCPQDCSVSITPTATVAPTATPTTEPNTTSLKLSFKLVGIGNSTGSAGLNNNPQRLRRQFQIIILNSQNQPVETTKGTALYYGGADSFVGTGTYTGTVTLASNFQTGSYLIKVRMDNTLWKVIPGIQIIGAHENNSITTPVTLVTGDVNQDNEINLLDYNLFLSCIRGDDCPNGPFSKATIQELMYAFNVKKTYERD